MTKFEELCDLFSKSRNDYFKYEDECIHFAADLTKEFITYFKIPQEQITYIPTNKEPEEDKRYTLFGAMHLDDDTFWHIGIILTLFEKPNVYPYQPVLMIIKLKKENGDFIVSLKGQSKTFKLNGKNPKTFVPFFEYIYENISVLFKSNLQKFLKNSSITKSIGFTI